MKWLMIRFPNMQKRLIPSLIIAALVGFWLYFTLTTPARAFVNWLPGVPPSYDADLSYIYNSILPFAGYSYAHVYHPGTAMHAFGTVVGALAYPLAQIQGVSLAAFHAGNPFLLLTALRFVLLVLACVVSVWLYWESVAQTGRRTMLIGASVAVSFFALYAFGFISLVSWAHASMGYTFGGLILLGLLRGVTTPIPSPSPVNRGREQVPAMSAWGGFRGGAAFTTRQIWTLGILAGIINATAYYYLPFVTTVALTVALVRWAQGNFWRGVLGGVQAGVASVVGFLLINAPIWHKFDQFLGSFVTLASRTGTHGTGERGFISLSGLISGAREVYGLYPTPYWALGGLVVLLLLTFFFTRARWTEHAPLWAFALALVSHVILGFLLIFRHPGGSYLNIVVPAAPFMLIVLFRVWESVPRLRLAAPVLAGLLLAGFTAQFINVAGLHNAVVRDVSAKLDETNAIITSYAATTGQRPEDVLMITTYGTHFGCYGMWFGSGYTQYQLHEHVGSACPNMVEFKGGFDGAQVSANTWKLLTDDDFCWDMAILERYGGEGLLGEFAEPQILDSGYTLVMNDRIFAPSGGYRADFDLRPCGRGWHAPQRDGDITYAWTSDPTATLEFTLTPNTDYRLTIQLYAAITPDVAESLSLSMNGEPLPLEPTDTPNAYITIIPAELIAANPAASTLTLTTHRVEVPGIERGDLRPLGVAVDSVIVAAVG